MSKSKPIIWALCDDRPGNVSQVIGVADAIGMNYIAKNLRYNCLASVPNVLLGSSKANLNRLSKSKITEPWPDLVISAGRRTAPVMRYIKAASNGKTKIVQIMWPGGSTKDFDMLVIPEHDSLYDDINIYKTLGAPNQISQWLIESEAEKKKDKLTILPGPRIALMVGGDTKAGKFTIEHAKTLGEKVKSFAKEQKASLLVSTSRRTSKEAAMALRESLQGVSSYFYEYGPGKDNPYLGYLGIADTIIVTGDSISMCSEACSTGKPVYIYSSNDFIPEKHRKLHRLLFEKKYAKNLLEEQNISSWNYKPLNESNKVAKEIKKVFL